MLLRNAAVMRAGGRDRTGSLSGTGRASSLQDLAGMLPSTGVLLRRMGVAMNAELAVVWTEGLEPSPSAWGADVLPTAPRPPNVPVPPSPVRAGPCVGLPQVPL